jgi:hypothetical protein
VPFDSIDVASGQEPTKRVAREMMRVVARIDGDAAACARPSSTTR